MASSKLFIILAIAAIIAPSVLGKDHIVGDETGWTTNFDYQAWAKAKEFRVGDRLIFNYPEGSHNVIRADGASFKQCMKPSNVEALTSGSDVITLATPGKKWYFCGFPNHCDVGNQKLTITVLAQGEVSSPAPSPSDLQSAATGRTGSVYFGMMALMVAFLIFLQ
ncbi:hypothetical protein AB3S75_024364 [Citrus x aurantiifolia]